MHTKVTYFNKMKQNKYYGQIFENLLKIFKLNLKTNKV
jgi:hypothetical protein